jgi:drug/metabolite transporter (DMT)-like permease
MNRERTFGLLCLIAVMIIWGSTFVVTKTAAREIPPLTLATLRFVIASVILVPIALSRGGLQRLPQPLPWRNLILMALTGVAAFAITFNYALVYGAAAQGAIVYALVPAGIALAAVLFLRERVSRWRVLGMVLSVIGVVIVAAGGDSSFGAPNPVLGAMWMFGAVLAWTSYTILAKRLAAADPIVTIAVVSTLGAMMLLPVATIEVLTSSVAFEPTLAAWGGALFLGVFASALAYIAYGFALRVLDATVVGVYTNLNPIIGVAAAVLFLGEVLYPSQIAGGLIAFAGMWLASRER